MMDLVFDILLLLFCLFKAISIALIFKYYVCESDNDNA